MNIGMKLKNHRKQRNLTQEQVAEKLHVTRATVSSWETGRTCPDIEKLIYLSELYELSLDELIREEPKIVEIISEEQKKLKNYRLVKIFATVVMFVITLYSFFWIITVLPKNNRLEKWQSIGNSYYLEKGNYQIKARKQQFPLFLEQGQIPMYVTTLATENKDEVSMYLYGDEIKVIINEDGVSKEFVTDHKLNLKKIGGIPVEDAIVLSRETVDNSKEEFASLYSELNKMLSAVSPVWNEIN